jgi:hypothetical protein
MLHNGISQKQQTNKHIMQKWFKCVVNYLKIDDDGRERKVSEAYLIDAVTYTDAEARIIAQLATMVRGEFVVKQITQTNIVEIFPHKVGEWWFIGKISIVTIDENAGKEKKTNNAFLIAADDIKQALKRLEEGLEYILVPYKITSLAISNIVDVFPYFGEEVNKQIPSNLKPIVKAEDKDE